VSRRPQHTDLRAGAHNRPEKYLYGEQRAYGADDAASSHFDLLYETLFLLKTKLLIELGCRKPLSKTQLKRPGSSLKMWSKMFHEKAIIVGPHAACVCV
jgi:hypothetical protein